MSQNNNEVAPTRVIQGVEYYSIGDASNYCGMSRTGFSKAVARFNENNPDKPITQFEYPGTKAKLIKRQDLDRMMQPRPIEGPVE